MVSRRRVDPDLCAQLHRSRRAQPDRQSAERGSAHHRCADQLVDRSVLRGAVQLPVHPRGLSLRHHEPACAAGQRDLLLVVHGDGVRLCRELRAALRWPRRARRRRGGAAADRLFAVARRRAARASRPRFQLLSPRHRRRHRARRLDRRHALRPRHGGRVCRRADPVIAQAVATGDRVAGPVRHCDFLPRLHRTRAAAAGGHRRQRQLR